MICLPPHQIAFRIQIASVSAPVNSPSPVDDCASDMIYQARCGQRPIRGQKYSVKERKPARRVCPAIRFSILSMILGNLYSMWGISLILVFVLLMTLLSFKHETTDACSLVPSIVGSVVLPALRTSSERLLPLCCGLPTETLHLPHCPYSISISTDSQLLRRYAFPKLVSLSQ